MLHFFKMFQHEVFESSGWSVSARLIDNKFHKMENMCFLFSIPPFLVPLSLLKTSILEKLVRTRFVRLKFFFRSRLTVFSSQFSRALQFSIMHKSMFMSNLKPVAQIGFLKTFVPLALQNVPVRENWQKMKYLSSKSGCLYPTFRSFGDPKHF